MDVFLSKLMRLSLMTLYVLLVKCLFVLIIYKLILHTFVYNLVFSILFPKVKSKDVNSKPKIFTRKVLESLTLTSDDWFIDAEIMVNASRLGIVFYEFPIDFYELQGRTSFVKFYAIFEFIRNLIVLRFKAW